MNYFSSDFKLGILGGGQLGKMLLSDTRKFDIATLILDPSIEAPAQFGAYKFFQGDLMDFETVYEFGKQTDVLTIEIENVNLDALDKLEAEGKKVFPSPKTLRLIQHKGRQKDFYIENNIPTAPYKRFEDIQSLKDAVNNKEISVPFLIILHLKD